MLGKSTFIISVVTSPRSKELELDPMARFWKEKFRENPEQAWNEKSANQPLYTHIDSIAIGVETPSGDLHTKIVQLDELITIVNKQPLPTLLLWNPSQELPILRFAHYAVGGDIKGWFKHPDLIDQGKKPWNLNRVKDISNLLYGISFNMDSLESVSAFFALQPYGQGATQEEKALVNVRNIFSLIKKIG